MADIKYVSELNFKRGLKGVVDWIKEKYVKATIGVNGGDYPDSATFHQEGDTGYSIGFGVNDSTGTPYIKRKTESTYTYNLAQKNELTSWSWTYANQETNTLESFTIGGPEVSASSPSLTFTNTDTNTLTFNGSYDTGSNTVIFTKNLPTKEYVDGIGIKTVSNHKDKGQSNQALTGLGIYKFGGFDVVGYHITSTDNGYQITIVDEASGGDVQSVTKQLPDEARVNALITAGLGSISGVNFQVVQTLPTTGVNGVFYLIANPTATGSNIYDEYVWVNKGTPETPDYAFERLGTMDVDLTDYTKTTDFVALSNDEVDAVLVEIGVKTATPTP